MRRLRRLTAATVVILAWSAALTVGASATTVDQGPGCSNTVDMDSAARGCTKSAEETVTLFAVPDHHSYRIELECGTTADNTGCLSSRRCNDTPGGLWYMIYRDNIAYARTCLDPSTAEHLGAITPAMVQREFHKLHWPPAPLTIAPPHGQTLVNLPTIFSTTLNTPTTQHITLLGQDITIQATPTTYTWHPGTPETPWHTTTPGHPWTPGTDPNTLNTHTYLHPGTYHLSTDVTYTGRYRIANHDWITIPTTLTIHGPTTTLDVLEARAQLTGP